MKALIRYLSVSFLVTCLGVLPAWARPTTEAEAQRSVAGWLNLDQRPLRARMGVKTGQIKAFKDSVGRTDYFVVSLEAGGFAVVAGDDLLEPIIAFAPQGTFDPNPENPLYILLSRDVPIRLAKVREKEDQAQARGEKYIPKGLHRRARGKWELLQSADTAAAPLSASLASVSDLRVEPLVQSKWSQSYEGTQLCYNYYTPYYYVCGCVATALAQLLRYHCLPSGAVGMLPFTVYVGGMSRTVYLRGGDDLGGPYEWNNMILDPDATTPELSRRAIGRLTADAGATVHMNYGPLSSGSFTKYVPVALTNTFGFNNARYAFNANYTIPSVNLNTMINPNLDARFPAILGILDELGNGHEIVVDGYGYSILTLYHHLNLGWAGTADAWYNLPTVSAASYNFTSVIECVYNIFPQGAGEIISGRVLDAAGQPINEAAITATSTSAGTYSATSNSLGIYALAKIPSAATYTITASKTGYNFYPKTVSTGTSLDNDNATGNLWGIDFVENTAGITLNQALDNYSLAILTGGNATWSGQTLVSYAGGSSAQSGVLGNNQSTQMQTTVVGPGSLSFYWKVSSEENFDFLEVFLDDVLQTGTISGEVDWQRRTISIPAGSHIVKWVYSKDEYVGMGSDCGWVDEVSFLKSRKGYLMPILHLLLSD